MTTLSTAEVAIVEQALDVYQHQGLAGLWYHAYQLGAVIGDRKVDRYGNTIDFHVIISAISQSIVIDSIDSMAVAADQRVILESMVRTFRLSDIDSLSILARSMSAFLFDKVR